MATADTEGRSTTFTLTCSEYVRTILGVFSDSHRYVHTQYVPFQSTYLCTCAPHALIHSPCACTHVLHTHSSILHVCVHMYSTRTHPFSMCVCTCTPHALIHSPCVCTHVLHTHSSTHHVCVHMYSTHTCTLIHPPCVCTPTYICTNVLTLVCDKTKPVTRSESSKACFHLQRHRLRG